MPRPTKLQIAKEQLPAPKNESRISRELDQAIKKVEKNQGTTLLEHFIKRAYENDRVLVALLKKMIPDKSIGGADFGGKVLAQFNVTGFDKAQTKIKTTRIDPEKIQDSALVRPKRERDDKYYQDLENILIELVNHLYSTIGELNNTIEGCREIRKRINA